MFLILKKGNMFDIHSKYQNSLPEIEIPIFVILLYCDIKSNEQFTYIYTKQVFPTSLKLLISDIIKKFKKAIK